jgi:hypothetical protein
MFNYMLERQTKSSDGLMHRLIEERNRKKRVDPNVNPPSSSSYVVNFAQTNPQKSGTSTDSTRMPNP